MPAPRSLEKLPDRTLSEGAAAEAVLQVKVLKNRELEALNEPPLIPETLAGRLYTGPLFGKYNAALRSIKTTSSLRDAVIRLCCPPDTAQSYFAAPPKRQAELFEAALAHANLYTTTLHAINSCVVKSGKLTRATKVYRGISGMALPRTFWHQNRFGVRGGVENGFMSTTTKRDVAMGYATTPALGWCSSSSRAWSTAERTSRGSRRCRCPSAPAA